MDQKERQVRIIPKKAEIAGSIALAASVFAAWGCGSTDAKKASNQPPEYVDNIGQLTANAGGILSVKTETVRVEPTIEKKPTMAGIDFTLKSSSGREVDIGQDAKFANKPILIFYYGRKLEINETSLEVIKEIKKTYTDLAIMPIILDNDPRLVQILGPSLGEVFVDESNTQSEASIALRIQGYPSTVILNKDHKIVFIKNGTLNQTDAAQIKDTFDVFEKR